MEYEAKLINVVAGVIFGIAPFIAGMLRDRMDLAFVGLILCAILGKIGGIYLSILCSLIAVAAIALSKKGEKS